MIQSIKSVVGIGEPTEPEQHIDDPPRSLASFKSEERARTYYLEQIAFRLWRLESGEIEDE